MTQEIIADDKFQAIKNPPERVFYDTADYSAAASA
jgi:hypothetical protein